MDFGTVNFEDLFDFSPEPLDSREAEVERQNETGEGGFLSGFSGTSNSRGEGEGYQQRVKQGDGGGWAGGGADGGQQYSHSIGIPQVNLYLYVGLGKLTSLRMYAPTFFAALPSTQILTIRHCSC